MCTVSFFPLDNNEFVLTSNRDELPMRETLPPQVFSGTDTKLLYPKDALAGGTWIGASTRKRVISLMNGGFQPHVRKSHYRLSRGLIVIELLESINLQEKLKSSYFTGIEPFTIILFEFQTSPALFQIVWDETSLHIRDLPLIPSIWSSTPLYSPEMHSKRVEWFNHFIADNTIDSDTIWDFHHHAGGDNDEFALIMDRGFIHTKSITQFKISTNQVRCIYHDLENKQLSENSLSLIQ